MCDDYLSPTIYREIMRKANKNHECKICGNEIIQGENYLHINGLWEDKWSNVKVCDHCIAVRKFLDDENLCHGIDDIHEILRENYTYYDDEEDRYHSTDDRIKIDENGKPRIK